MSIADMGLFAVRPNATRSIAGGTGRNSNLAGHSSAQAALSADRQLTDDCGPLHLDIPSKPFNISCVEREKRPPHDVVAEQGVSCPGVTSAFKGTIQ